MDIRLFLLLLLLSPLSLLRAEKLTVAAAANLTYVMGPLDAAFKKAEPAVEVTTVTGASGNFFAQIQNGAPVDVFLSADLDYPKKLVDAGNADAASLCTYATGRLVLWTTDSKMKLANLATALADPRVKHIAIADPATSPYGRATKEALSNLDLWTANAGKFILAESITQTAQLVETGNAEIGFAALSLMLAPKRKIKGSYCVVPGELYQPLDQGAVITRHGAANTAAKRYLEFLKSRAARDIFEHFGYGVPPSL